MGKRGRGRWGWILVLSPGAQDTTASPPLKQNRLEGHSDPSQPPSVTSPLAPRPPPLTDPKPTDNKRVGGEENRELKVPAAAGVLVMQPWEREQKPSQNALGPGITFLQEASHVASPFSAPIPAGMNTS